MHRLILVLLLFTPFLGDDRPFVIQVVDGQTGRGVPLVELRTVNQQAWYTDSNGNVTIPDPWLLGHDVFFTVHSDGYVFDEKVDDEQGKILRVQSGVRAQLRSLRHVLCAVRI